MVLDQILAHKRDEVAARKAATSLESLRARAVPTTRSLTRALRAGRPGFILEIKFASPSAGIIRSGAELTPVVASYGRHADAVSVLTDQRFFGGSLERLTQVRQLLHQPLLAKDFILEPYQVVEARAHGADAILLILAAIDDQTWRACADEAGRLGMEVLTEVHDEAEASRAVALGAGIIGINNRDLRTLAVDADTTARVSPRIPQDRLVVAESGIASRETVARLRPHADAFLVGSALMGAPDLDRAVRDLVYGRTKICGLTRAEDAARALEAGATHGGLMFAADSPRRISALEAREVSAGAPLSWVGVFADQPPEEIAAAAADLDLAAVQLHGNESPDQAAEVRRQVPAATAVWKAERVQERIPARGGADRLLLDGWTAGRLGGTGRTFDWSLLEQFPERAEVILAGGLRASNVAAAAALETWALDASSGVESAPGRKDPGLLRDFFTQRRRLPGRGDSLA
ncbi:MAG TPA: bifunctional indole-3-glycerol-phosphate synthase TrpC/phosphoribosylanthranilate isomerase TrpF [Gemmatimonadales bacterium]|nr:bifunctional indole-3-glycerol-phosphate synthase TrpC/phosphoribosylanthranilate isomerase TrpF [Gemmatimonadales bacterium]